MIRRQRKKAWIGAAISAVGGIAGSLLSASAQKKAEQEKKIRQNRVDALNQAQALTDAYSDQTYVDDFNKKIVGKYGTSFKNDRINRTKRFKCGGKRKFANGGELTNEAIGSGITTLGELVSQNNNYDTGQDITPQVINQLPTQSYNRLQRAKFGKRIYLK